MVLATIIRLEMAYPGVGILAGDSLQYLSIVTAHAVIMVFFMIMPLLFGAFGNFLLPTQLGVHDVAFPRLNSAAFWFLPAGLIMLGQLICLDRRYQRMNCFNIREVEALLKTRFFPDLINSQDYRTVLNHSMVGLRFKTNNVNLIHSNISLVSQYGLLRNLEHRPFSYIFYNTTISDYQFYQSTPLSDQIFGHICRYLNLNLIYDTHLHYLTYPNYNNQPLFSLDTFRVVFNTLSSSFSNKNHSFLVTVLNTLSFFRDEILAVLNSEVNTLLSFIDQRLTGLVLIDFIDNSLTVFARKSFFFDKGFSSFRDQVLPILVNKLFSLNNYLSFFRDESYYFFISIGPNLSLLLSIIVDNSPFFRYDFQSIRKLIFDVEYHALVTLFDLLSFIDTLRFIKYDSLSITISLDHLVDFFTFLKDKTLII